MYNLDFITTAMYGGIDTVNHHQAVQLVYSRAALNLQLRSAAFRTLNRIPQGKRDDNTEPYYIISSNLLLQVRRYS